MNTRFLMLGLASLSATVFAAPPVVTVTYEQPEKFTDVKAEYFANERERDHILGELKRYIEESAARRIPDGSQLSVTVSDVDMAGGFDMASRAPELWRVRMVRDIYPPRMDLAFKLVAADGRVVNEGSRKLIDLGFLMRNYRISSDMLRYEKAMLDGWLAKEFPRPR